MLSLKALAEGGAFSLMEQKGPLWKQEERGVVPLNKFLKSTRTVWNENEGYNAEVKLF